MKFLIESGPKTYTTYTTYLSSISIRMLAAIAPFNIFGLLDNIVHCTVVGSSTNTAPLIPSGHRD